MSVRTKLLMLLTSAALIAGLVHGVDPTWAQEKAKVHIRGKITKMSPSEIKAGIKAVILIEGDKQKDTEYDKAWAKVMDTTSIKMKVGKDLKDAKLEDLKIGCEVEASFTGPVLESYPVQVTIKEIVILEGAK